MKYKTGDKIRIKKILCGANNSYGINEDMKKQQGKIVTISKVTQECDGETEYKIEEDRGWYVWTQDCFENNRTNTKLNINKVIYNGPATIIEWQDDTKTVVKQSKEDASTKSITGDLKESYEKRIGFLTAYFQKTSGMSKTQANKYIEKITKGEE